jgi:hypothetical protein
MARQFPFMAAASVTAIAGVVVTTIVRAAVEVPVVPHVPVSVGMRPSAAPPVTPPAQLPGNAVNTPGSTGPAFSPGNPNLNVGANAAPAVVQANAYGQAAMNQPGQPSYGETFISNQTSMNQPGQADFYEGTNNPNITQANQGIVPSNAYQNPSSPASGVSTTATTTLGFGQTQSPNTVGFFNGFGAGQPNFGFYSGFTAPR